MRRWGMPAGTSATTSATPASDRLTGGHRRDVEGLRGVAVLVVVLYHVGVPGFGGGFVGVDVFFVISGFLITGLLFREWQRSDSVGLCQFWARRIRRLNPALALMLFACLLLSLV